MMSLTGHKTVIISLVGITEAPAGLRAKKGSAVYTLPKTGRALPRWRRLPPIQCCATVLSSAEE